MNKFLKIALIGPLVCTGVAMGVALVASPSSGPGEVFPSHAAMHDRIDACREALQRRTVSSRPSEPVYLGSEGSNKWMVEIEFTASNRFGAQVPGLFTCVGRPDGNFRTALQG